MLLLPSLSNPKSAVSSFRLIFHLSTSLIFARHQKNRENSRMDKIQEDKSKGSAAQAMDVHSQDIQPRTKTVMKRRGLGRPSLKRHHQSSFTFAVASVSAIHATDLSAALASTSLDTRMKERDKEDIKLLHELKDESIPPTPSFDDLPRAPGINRFSHWECGFGFSHPPLTPSSAPFNVPDFLKAVAGELNTLTFVKAGLSRYTSVINSGEHTVFPQSFLDKQRRSTEITLAQLDRIKAHLDEIVRELGEIQEGGQDEVRSELQEVFSHAKPWIAKIRAVMISSHVFYKTNYALAADARKEKERK